MTRPEAPSGAALVLSGQVVTARCDLDQCQSYKKHIFNFAVHRRPEHYGPIAAPC